MALNTITLLLLICLRPLHNDILVINYDLSTLYTLCGIMVSNVVCGEDRGFDSRPV